MDIQHHIHTTRCGKKIARIRLDAPKRLNALNLQMINEVQALLEQWREQPDIVMVWLEGEGEKAFCAGGDVVSLYQAVETQSSAKTFVSHYFESEYRLDYSLHCYPKPVLVWADGYVMGGGAGLMQGASHRIVTERTRFAMPEINIGLFPDVGASYFLSRLPEPLGLWLGLTASQLNSTDLLQLKLADFQLVSDKKATLLDACLVSEWPEQGWELHLTELLQGFCAEQPLLLESELAALLPEINHCFSTTEPAAICENIMALTASEHSSLQKAAAALRYGSPITAAVCFELLARGRELSLAECFAMEHRLATNIVLQGDFQEGVRALLVDKSRDPVWKHSGIDRVESDFVKSLFDA